MTMTPFYQPACMSVRQLTKMSISEVDFCFRHGFRMKFIIPKQMGNSQDFMFAIHPFKTGTQTPRCLATQRLQRSPSVSRHQALFERMGAVGGQLL